MSTSKTISNTLTVGGVSSADTPTLSGTNTFSGTDNFTQNVTAAAVPTLGNHLVNKTYVDGTFLTQTSASSTYLPTTTAASTYLTQTSAASTYLPTTTAASTYLTQTSAASTYLPTTTAASTYLTQANATSTYLPSATAASTYLTQTSASTTYAPKATPIFTGTTTVTDTVVPTSIILNSVVSANTEQGCIQLRNRGAGNGNSIRLGSNVAWNSTGFPIQQTSALSTGMSLNFGNYNTTFSVTKHTGGTGAGNQYPTSPDLMTLDSTGALWIAGNLQSPTVTGTVTCSTAPSVGADLCNKTYVDTFLSQTSAASTYAPKASPSFTGNVMCSSSATTLLTTQFSNTNSNVENGYLQYYNPAGNNGSSMFLGAGMYFNGTNWAQGGYKPYGWMIHFGTNADSLNIYRMSAGVTGVISSIFGTTTNLFNLDNAGNLSVTGNISPFVTNTKSLGSASFLWSQLYAATSTINTSDRTEKTDISSISNAEKSVGLELKTLFKKYKFKNALTEKGDNNARTHFGIMAQDVQGTFEKYGLDANQYGVFCSDALVDASGNPVLDASGNPMVRLGVRYDELFALVLAAM